MNTNTVAKATTTLLVGTWAALWAKPMTDECVDHLLGFAKIVKRKI